MWPWSTYPTCSLENVASPLPQTDPAEAVTYDYIIVGGGTAGCVLASRLSEDPSVSVLLVERGEAVTAWVSRVPLLSLNYLVAGGPLYKWASAPLEAISKVTHSMLSGKALGGSSKVNAFLYTRSTPGEYEKWKEEGHEGWGWDHVLPYFQKSESSLTFGGREWRGDNGPWQNQRLPEIYFDSINKFFSASEALNIPYTPEANAPSAPATSVFRADMTIDASARRCSTFDAFLPPHLARARARNLKICSGVIVQSLDIEKTDGGKLRVRGVHLEHDEEKRGSFYAKARKEVIVCSGAIGTPQLLLMSGLGPAAHLEQHSVPVLKDLPGVGSHLQDHLGVPVLFRCPLADSMHIIESSTLTALREMLKYVLFGRGLFLAPNPQALLFARSALLDDEGRTIGTPEQLDARDPANIPDLEIMPIPYRATDNLQDTEGDGILSLLVVLLRPKSNGGTVRLRSADARDRPECDLGSLADAEDVAVLRKGVRLALAIGEEMKKLGYPLKDLVQPASGTDADVDKHIMQCARTTYHYASTCRMAPEQAGGVVDDELRVYGVDNLRVADASVFPSIPATHLQAPTVMVGEKCADMVRRAR